MKIGPAEITISGRKIGACHPCLVVAEIGVNHNGSVALASRMISAAAEAGADAVKFQTFESDRIVAADTPKAEYQKNRANPSETQLEMLRKYELDRRDYPGLIKQCKDLGLIFISTPFDLGSIDFLASVGVDAFKVGSAELTCHHFLRRIAGKGSPVILSTGMAYLGEVEVAISEIKSSGNKDIALLHCVSNYPSEAADANLRAMDTMSKAFRLPVGFSDHSLGMDLSIAAVAMGASIIEKHFTLDVNGEGPDHSSSMEPGDFARMVNGIRSVESALGDGIKAPRPSEIPNRSIGRRKIAASRKILSGARITEDDIIALRASKGISVENAKNVLGRKTAHDIFQGQPITDDDLL